MSIQWMRPALAVLVACLVTPSADLQAAKKPHKREELQILGWVEMAYLIEPGFELKAKLDTGARTSSLDARIIKRFRQYGKRWVRFAVRNPETGEETILVRERRRTIGIVQHEGDNDVRPTVLMDVCIAGIERTIEVSLIDRERFTYPLLLGRRTLRHIAIVHPDETFLSDSHCIEPPVKRDVQGQAPSRTESPEEESEPPPDTDQEDPAQGAGN